MDEFHKWRRGYGDFSPPWCTADLEEAWDAATAAAREKFLQIVHDVRRDRADLFAREGEPGAALVVHSTCNYIQSLLEEHSCAAAIREANDDE